MHNFIKSYKNLSVIFILCSIITNCTTPQKNPESLTIMNDAQVLHECNQALTDIMVHDIFSPPVASRNYAYANIAAYEVLVKKDKSLLTLAGQLTDLNPIPDPEKNADINYSLAMFEAFTIVAKAMIYTEEIMDEFILNYHEKFKENINNEEIYEESKSYGELVAKHILSWASKDKFSETRTDKRFVVNNDKGRWTPTPPDYLEGIEPNWFKIRPFAIDSCNQFQPVPPFEYNMDKSSPFYKELMEVYDVRQNLTEDQRTIAAFWDCNPFVSRHQGHLMMGSKKISPGGHWMGITAIATKQSNLALSQTSEVYTMVAITLADGFISCWDEKYRSNVIRPVTAINNEIDPMWKPVLQTPPFPEYTSGHSVISTAAAAMLTHLMGEPFSYIDSVEVKYGLPARSFNSFNEASSEAAISRLYGGIHYRSAIENGVNQGRELGSYIINKIQTRSAALTSNSN